MTKLEEEFRVALNDLRQDEDAYVGGGASDDEIDRAERELGVEFPNDYRLFLRICGWGGRDDWEIFGVGEDAPKFLNLVQMTTTERAALPTLPHDLIPIMNDGGFNLYCLGSATHTSGSSSKIALLDLEDEESDLLVVADSFAAWLVQKMTSV